MKMNFLAKYPGLLFKNIKKKSIFRLDHDLLFRNSSFSAFCHLLLRYNIEPSKIIIFCFQQLKTEISISIFSKHCSILYAFDLHVAFFHFLILVGIKLTRKAK